ncbi:signal peptidase II [Acetobacteraceae bacterium]|nr:signal peptidase II [Acetobacteraceae bacterium]
MSSENRSLSEKFQEYLNGFSWQQATFSKFAAFGLIVLVFIIDQWSKGLILEKLGGFVHDKQITPFFDLVLVRNKAVTFGMLGGVTDQFGPWIFILISLFASVFLGLCLWRAKSPVVALCCGLIIGGALGNAWDRFDRGGTVVDFLYFHIGEVSWYVFNLADTAIVGGVMIWMIYSFLNDRKKSSIEG